MHDDLIIISLTARDDPGADYRTLALLGSHDLDILDIGQAVIHGFAKLSVLVRMPSESAGRVLRDLLYSARELGLALEFFPVPPGNPAPWLSQDVPGRYILTLLGRRLSSRDLASVLQLVESCGLALASMRCLSGGQPVPEGRICVESSLRGQPVDVPRMRAELMSIASELEIDVSVQADDLFRRNRRLVVFDMDSTLIDAEVIDELALAAGVGDKVAAITESAMQGKIDFQDSLRQRVAALSGLPEAALMETAEKVPLMEGAERLFRLLGRLGYRTAILSGGFSCVGERLQQQLGVDYVYANTLEVRGGRLTGQVLDPIVDGERKAELLGELAAREQISLEQVIAVGDGSNDIPMLSRAGLGIAFRAKPLVRESADHTITELGLDSILYLMGIHDRDVDTQALSEDSASPG